ncbi:hypothetical protein FOA52_006664 [Chlamydomonas sp. UWO 241]|nr:hypothetical protein FOA52_006664 [Chlamydomonas sp. UWO 241]
MSFASKLTALLNGQATATALGVASRTGLLAALSPTPASAAGLAAAAGLAPRYVQEILAALVCGEVVTLDACCDPPLYALPAEHQEALRGMAMYFEELPLLAQCAFDQVCSAARSGGGVPSAHYGAFGAWMGKVAAEKHERQLVQTFLPSLDNGRVVAQLGGAAARVLDMGCGHGVAARLVARAFPQATVVGVDIDAASIEAARAHPEAARLPNLHFHVGDASSGGDALRGALGGRGDFDLILSMDAIHDLPDPAGAMATARALLRPDATASDAEAGGGGGVFAMVDIRARTELQHNVNHPMAPFLYCVSLLHCMPQGLNHCGAGLGMMWGRERAVAMLREAGFGSVEVVEMEFDTFNDCYLCRQAAAAPAGGGAL